jgi:hypothetical protein
MLPNPNDGGLLSHAYHFSKSADIESRKRGREEPVLKLVMGGALVIIGARMAMDAWQKMHGGRVR